MLIVMTAVFFITRALGDPVVLLLPDNFTQEQYDALKSRLGYDRPVLAQFGTYVTDVLRGDFGSSTIYRKDALEVVLERFPFTAAIAVGAVLLALLVGVPLGLYCGYRANGIIDRLATLLSTIGLAFPGFVLAILLVLIFGVWFRVFPVAGLPSLTAYVLPVVSLSLWTMSSLFRFARSGALEAVNSPFVTLAEAKGLRPWTVLLRHIAPTAMGPIVTFGALQLGALLGGAVLIETVFAIPGVGQLAVEAVLRRDNSVVLAVVTLSAAIFIVVNLAADLLIALVDPRVGREIP